MRRGKTRTNSRPPLVATGTLEPLGWTATPPREGAHCEIERDKEEAGGHFPISGSGALARSLVERGLTDEFHLMVCPVVVGEGTPLFSQGSRATLHVTEVRSTASGC